MIEILIPDFGMVFITSKHDDKSASSYNNGGYLGEFLIFIQKVKICTSLAHHLMKILTENTMNLLHLLENTCSREIAMLYFVSYQVFSATDPKEPSAKFGAAKRKTTVAETPPLSRKSRDQHGNLRSASSSCSPKDRWSQLNLFHKFHYYIHSGENPPGTLGFVRHCNLPRENFIHCLESYGSTELPQDNLGLNKINEESLFSE